MIHLLREKKKKILFMAYLPGGMIVLTEISSYLTYLLTTHRLIGRHYTFICENSVSITG